MTWKAYRPNRRPKSANAPWRWPRSGSIAHAIDSKRRWQSNAIFITTMKASFGVTERREKQDDRVCRHVPVRSRVRRRALTPGVMAYDGPAVPAGSLRGRPDLFRAADPERAVREGRDPEAGAPREEGATQL